jgi:hypothetical protein
MNVQWKLAIGLVAILITAVLSGIVSSRSRATGMIVGGRERP